MKPTTKIEFPMIHFFDDYHEIDPYLDILNELFEENIKACEAGFVYAHGYCGIFYVGKKPSKEKLLDLIAEKGIELDEEGREMITYILQVTG